MRKIYSVVLMVIVFALLSACTTIGPQTIPRDRFDYNTAISNSWKEQTLLNIVKLRYADMPLFVEIASIVNGYTLESTVNLGGIHTGTISSDIFSLGGGAGKFSDRPTITYALITGQRFNKISDPVTLQLRLHREDPDKPGRESLPES